jgi:hypothetical protein
LDITCSYFTTNGVEYACDDSEAFSELEFDQCNVDFKYKYSIVNNYEESTTIIKMYDESLVNILGDAPEILGPNSSPLEIEIDKKIDVCQHEGSKVKKDAVLVASLANSGDFKEARGGFEFHIP